MYRALNPIQESIASSVRSPLLQHWVIGSHCCRMLPKDRTSKRPMGMTRSLRLYPSPSFSTTTLSATGSSSTFLPCSTTNRSISSDGGHHKADAGVSAANPSPAQEAGQHSGSSAHCDVEPVLDVLSEGLCLDPRQCRDAARNLAVLVSTDRQLHCHASSVPRASRQCPCGVLLLISGPRKHYPVRHHVDGAASERLVKVQMAVGRALAVRPPVVPLMVPMSVEGSRIFHLHSHKPLRTPGYVLHKQRICAWPASMARTL